MSVLPAPAEKAAYVQQMFANIAQTYDLVNRTMTFGMDQGWRKYIVETVAPPCKGFALDVGTGTGDFLPLLAPWLPKGQALGLDFCLPMMQQGLTKLAETQKQTTFVGGDALFLPFPAESFDVITTAFVMRNVTDIKAAFREMWRVAKPGGVIGCLEVARPRNPLFRLGHQIYFEQIVPFIGGFLSKDHRAYTYLPQSARAFPHPDLLATLMQEAGWQHVHYKLLGFGAVAAHIGTKLV